MNGAALLFDVRLQLLDFGIVVEINDTDGESWCLIGLD